MVLSQGVTARVRVSVLKVQGEWLGLGVRVQVREVRARFRSQGHCAATTG